MTARDLHPGDRVQVNRKGLIFSATLDTQVPAGWLIRDPEPSVGYRTVTPRQIVKQLETTTSKGAA